MPQLLLPVRDDGALLSAVHVVLAEREPAMLFSARERLSLLVSACTGAMDNAQLQLKATSYLTSECRRLEIDATNMRIAIECGTLHYLIKTMGYHASNAKISTEAAAALGNVAAGSYTAAKGLICEAGGCDAVVLLLTQHGQSNAEACVQGFRAIGNMCFGMDDGGGKDCKQRVSDAGGIKLIVDLMEHHKHSAAVMRWGCHAIGNLVYGRAPNPAQSLALHSGACQILMLALKAHSADSKVLASACEAIGNMAFRNPEIGRVFLRGSGDGGDDDRLEGAAAILMQLPRHHSNAKAAGSMLFALSALPLQHEALLSIEGAVLDAVEANPVDKIVRKWSRALLSRIEQAKVVASEASDSRSGAGHGGASAI